MTDQLPNGLSPQQDDNPVSDTARESQETSVSSMAHNAFWCVVVAAGASLFYALKIESSLFRGIALQLALCSVAVWSAMDAVKIRRKLEAVEDENGQAVKREATAIHYLFVAAPLVAVLVLTGLSMVAQLAEVAVVRSQQQVVGGAILAVLAASLWTVLARVFQPHSDEGQISNPSDKDASSTLQDGPTALPEAAAVRAALLESRITALFERSCF